jgi:hypothetical protein
MSGVPTPEEFFDELHMWFERLYPSKVQVLKCNENVYQYKQTSHEFVVRLENCDGIHSNIEIFPTDKVKHLVYTIQIPHGQLTQTNRIPENIPGNLEVEVWLGCDRNNQTMVFPMDQLFVEIENKVDGDKVDGDKVDGDEIVQGLTCSVAHKPYVLALIRQLLDLEAESFFDDDPLTPPGSEVDPNEQNSEQSLLLDQQPESDDGSEDYESDQSHDPADFASNMDYDSDQSHDPADFASNMDYDSDQSHDPADFASNMDYDSDQSYDPADFAPNMDYDSDQSYDPADFAPNMDYDSDQSYDPADF